MCQHPPTPFQMCAHPPDTDVSGRRLLRDCPPTAPIRLEARALFADLRRFEDETVAEAWLIAQRWPDGVQCPKCGSDRIAEPPSRRPMIFRCRDCRTQFSVTSRSAMRCSKASLAIWAVTFHICSALCNSHAADIRDVLSVSNRSAWSLAMRIHEAWHWHLHPLRDAGRYGQRRLPEGASMKPRPLIRKEGGRSRRTIPPPLPASPEMLAKALFELPERHTWRFLKGRSLRG